ncbi:MAG: right-handed parallel beta-helix repeat-containing protein [Opitutales bacterium]
MKPYATVLAVLSLTLSSAFARVIDVSEHGIVPEKDATLALQRLLATVEEEAGVTLKFPKGTYVFHPENALEYHRAVSNHDNGLKRVIFPLFGYEDITIDGGDSLFMFHGVVSPFVVDGTEGAILKNFTVDWTRSFHDELPVVASDPEAGTFTVKIDPEQYPYVFKHGQLYSDKGKGWLDRWGMNITFDPKTRAPIYNTWDYTMNTNRPYTAKRVGEDTFQIAAKFRKSPPPVGSVFISYGNNPTSRLSPAIHLANAKDVRIEHVVIMAAGGMGVIAERTENVTIDHYKLTSSDERLVATRADATHFIGCKGEIRVENSLFEHMLDDAINVHGAYVKIVEPLEPKTFICEISHFQQWGLTFAEAGDRVALLSRETILPFFETEVTAVQKLNEHRFLVTLADVPEALPEGPLSMENLSWYPDVVFRNNIIRENRARGLLLTSKGKILIEDNYISSQMHGILIEGDNNKWYESGAVEDVIIRGNTFVNVGFDGGKTYPLYASPLLNDTQSMDEGHYHRNIRFTGNTIKSFNGHIAFASSVTGLEISNNEIEFSTDYPKLREHPAIVLEYTDSVKIERNRALGFEKTLFIEASKDSTAVHVDKNSGLLF